MNWSWDELVEPFRDFFASIIGYLPRIVGALALLLVAWILAKVLKSGARRLVRASGIDQRLGKEDRYPVAEGTGTAVFWIVWILAILAILQLLGVQGVFTSISLLFEKVFSAIPNILAAIVVLVIAYFLGRFVARVVSAFLTRIRFDELPVRLGLANQLPQGIISPSRIVGYIALVFVMLFAILMATDLLGFTIVSDLIATFTKFLALVLLGLIIIGVGIFFANLVANILRTSGRSPTTVSLVRVCIIILGVAIGLSSMGFINDIVLLIFGIILGAIAIAAAIAFGLGGRKVAGEMLERWTKSSGSDQDKTGE